MAIPKYKKYFQEMIEDNKDLFDTYLKLEEAYDKDKAKYKNDLSEIKLKLVRVIRKAEDRLCSRTETTKYGIYSTGLADKFWEEIRARFPRIDEIV